METNSCLESGEWFLGRSLHLQHNGDKKLHTSYADGSTADFDLSIVHLLKEKMQVFTF